MCASEVARFTFSLFTDTLTFFYHTDGFGGSRGLEITYSLIGKLIASC
jgi:hypothetical protein